MTTLDLNNGYLVLINAFPVDPSKAEELLEVLSEATADGMRQRAAFISASLPISTDKRHVANYVQWRNQADVDAMMNDPAAREHMGDAAKLADLFDPIYCELRESHAA